MKLLIREQKKFLWSLRGYFAGVFGIFLLSALVSFLFPELFHFFDPLLLKLLDEARMFQGWDLFIFIFQNNVLAASVGLLGGILFGIIPLGIGVMNGLLLGYVGARVVAEEGFLSLWRILPHGVFELPALFIALALGMRLGVASITLLHSLVNRKQKDDFMQILSSSLVAFCLFVIPLLVIAGIIESWFISVGV